MFFDRKPEHAAPQPDLASLTITDARVGDQMSISGAAADFSDLDFTVDRCNHCESGSRGWNELSGMHRDIRVFVEVHNDDTVEVRANMDGRKLTLDELGVSEDDLSEMDRRQNPADFFDYDGKFWLYRSSHEAGVFSGGNPVAKGYYAWEFQEQGGKRFLLIRKFDGEPFTAALWVGIVPGDVSIFRGAR